MKHIKELEKLKLPRDKFVITMSGALAMRGICENNDIDILVRKDIYDDLTRKYGSPGSRGTLHIGDYIEARLCTYNVDTDLVFDTADKIGGYLCMSIDLVLKAKRNRGLPKDTSHIDSVMNYLSSNRLN